LSHFNHSLSRVRKRTGYATIAPSGKEKAASPTLTETGTSTTATVITAKNDTLLLKKETVKVQVPTVFYGDRSKFKAYVL
jgi:hypothetical protein